MHVGNTRCTKKLISVNIGWGFFLDPLKKLLSWSDHKQGMSITANSHHCPSSTLAHAQSGPTYIIARMRFNALNCYYPRAIACTALQLVLVIVMSLTRKSCVIYILDVLQTAVIDNFLRRHIAMSAFFICITHCINGNYLFLILSYPYHAYRWSSLKYLVKAQHGVVLSLLTAW